MIFKIIKWIRRKYTVCILYIVLYKFPIMNMNYDIIIIYVYHIHIMLLISFWLIISMTLRRVLCWCLWLWGLIAHSFSFHYAKWVAVPVRNYCCKKWVSESLKASSDMSKLKSVNGIPSYLNFYSCTTSQSPRSIGI